MVLVYGAAGLLGEGICRRLRQEGKRIRSLLPRGTPAASLGALRRLNVELFVADPSDLPTVAAACSGTESIICADPAMLPSRSVPPLEAGGVRCLVELASALHVREFLFITVPERFETPCALVSARQECSARLNAHHMNHVVFDTGFFMETWLSPDLGFDFEAGTATVYGEGQRRIPWVSCEDVAELAVRSIGADHRRKRHIHVASRDSVSQLEVIRLFEEMRGRPFTVTHISEADLRAEHKRATDATDRVHAAMKVELAHSLPMRADEEDIPIPLLSVRDYAERAMGSRVRTAGLN